MNTLQELTPKGPHKTVRRSTRNTLGPKRLSYSPQREETQDGKKRVRDNSVATGLPLKFNNFNPTFYQQKVQKNPKHNPSKLQQAKEEEEEDENNVVDQAVSIKTLSNNHYYLKKNKNKQHCTYELFLELSSFMWSNPGCLWTAFRIWAEAPGNHQREPSLPLFHQLTWGKEDVASAGLSGHG